MIFYIENRRTEPAFNLALEQVIFDRAESGHSYFMLWQNRNAVIVGKHQNTADEINPVYIKEHNISVVRRLSGGGAVYHDLGNLNFTFIAPVEGNADPDFSFFCEPVRKALLSMGVPVEISGRNDMTVDGMKFSGNAQYKKNNRVMHHGTILYDSALETLSHALKPKEKTETRAIKSVRSPVANIKPYIKNGLDIDGFRSVLLENMRNINDMRDFYLTPEHLAAAEDLRDRVYSKWEWNYGKSPPYTLRKTRRIEGCGKVDVMLDIKQEGVIDNIAIYGDFFGNFDPNELCGLLNGHHLEYNELNLLLKNIDVSRFIHSLKTEAFLSLLFD